jgi:hypothetical protein
MRSTRIRGRITKMDTILRGIEFAIGMVLGLVMIFFIARWLRYRYYRTSKRRGDDLPPGIRVRYVKDALKNYEQARRKGITPEQAKDAHVALMAAARDESLALDGKTLDALGREAVTMLKIACGVTETK